MSSDIPASNAPIIVDVDGEPFKDKCVTSVTPKTIEQERDEYTADLLKDWLEQVSKELNKESK